MVALELEVVVVEVLEAEEVVVEVRTSTMFSFLFNSRYQVNK